MCVYPDVTIPRFHCTYIPHFWLLQGITRCYWNSEWLILKMYVDVHLIAWSQISLMMLKICLLIWKSESYAIQANHPNVSLGVKGIQLQEKTKKKWLGHCYCAFYAVLVIFLQLTHRALVLEHKKRDALDTYFETKGVWCKSKSAWAQTLVVTEDKRTENPSTLELKISPARPRIRGCPVPVVSLQLSAGTTWSSAGAWNRVQHGQFVLVTSKQSS